MTLRQVIENAEKSYSLGRIDVSMSIIYANDAIRKIAEAGGFEIEELVDDIDEKNITSQFEIIRMKSLLIGKDDKFVPLKEMKHDGFVRFEE